MAREIINVGGEDVNVREDTAKAFRGTYWALFSVAAIILITALLFFGGFFAWLTGSTTRVSPAASEPSQNSANR